MWMGSTPLTRVSCPTKVLQIRSVEFAGKYNVPLRVLHSFQEGPGTLITLDDEESMEQPIISGIAFNRDEAKLTIRGVPDTPGVAFKILGPVSGANIEVDMIVQNVSHDGTTDLSFTTSRVDLAAARPVLEKIRAEIGARALEIDERVAKVSIVGAGIQNAPGYAARMFGTLADAKINIQMISTSEIRITCIVSESDAPRALQALHEAFDLATPDPMDAE